MAKKAVFIFVLSISFFGIKAQTKNNYSSSQSNFEGYVIRLLPVNNNGFGYNVYFKSRMVIQQTSNPFTLSPLGFRNREDALKMAKWQVQQLHHQPTAVLIKNQRVSKDVARKLSVSIN